ncbi:hypothetical protein D3C78_1298170 [compost metagenome]
MLSAIPAVSMAARIACRTLISLNGGFELLSSISVIRGTVIGATFTPFVASMVFTAQGGITREICTSPLLIWVARVSASGIKFTRPPESFGIPFQ